MKKIFLLIATFALTFTACSTDESILEDNGTDVSKNPVAVNFSAGITTRTIGNTWQKDDLVGINATDNANVTYTNVQYKVAETGVSAAFNAVVSDDAICFQNTNTMSFSAYYPYTDVSATEGKIARNTAQTQDNVDFLWAKVDNVSYTETPTVNFTFVHRMSQINVKLTPAAEVDITGQAVVIGGLKHEGAFNTTNGQATANVDATAEDWTIGTPASNGEFTYQGLIYPQNTNALTLKAGEKTAILNLSGDKFEPGYKYTVTATVEKDRINAKITIEGNIIQDWEDGSGTVKTKIAFVSNGPSADACDDEAKTAYNWLISNDAYEVTYLSIGGDNASANLDQYKMVWAHFNFDDGNKSGGINSAIKDYYTTGGAILASREAMNSLISWGVLAEGQGINNNWGEDEILTYEAGICNTAYNHAIFNGLGLVANDASIALHPNPYTSSKRMRGWNWGDEAELNTWLSTTGAVRLARDYGKANSITIAEVSKTTRHGCAIIIGDPAFEWNGVTSTTQYADNIYKLTLNTIGYLVGESTK